MGSGVSRGPTAVGVPNNPRVQYAHKLEKKEKQKILIDAPVLVDVEHGSVRYREPGNDAPKVMKKGREHPHESEKGKDLASKEHYFYHPRLKEYGPDAAKEKEDSFKFYYVLKGPAAAQKTKLYYVYGQGWNAKDGLKVKPTEAVGEERDFAWSSTKKPYSLYYALHFEEGGDLKQTDEEDRLLSDLEPTPDKSLIRLNINTEERTKGVKARVGVRLLKAPSDIHIVFEHKELRDEDVIGDLRPNPEDNKQEDNKQEDNKQEDSKQENSKQEDSKQENSKQEPQELPQNFTITLKLL